MASNSSASSQSVAFKETGIPTIDQQHGELVSCLDRFLFWVAKGRGMAATFDVFESLAAYTRTHFEFEEQYMREHHYPKVDEHIKLHQQIIAGLDRLRADLEEGKDVEDDLTGTLRLWIVQHINVSDMDYAVFLGTAPANPANVLSPPKVPAEKTS